jgi:hypothetical protein
MNLASNESDIHISLFYRTNYASLLSYEKKFLQNTKNLIKTNCWGNKRATYAITLRKNSFIFY